MTSIIKTLRKFFRSRFWRFIVAHDPTTVSHKVVSGRHTSVILNTRISISLWVEGKFNEAAAAYMQWRKYRGL